MVTMAKKNNNEPLKRLIKHMEVWKRQQEALVTLHPKYSVEGAIANARVNTLSVMLGRANTYLVGGPDADKAFEELKRKL